MPRRSRAASALCLAAVAAASGAALLPRPASSRQGETGNVVSLTLRLRHLKPSDFLTSLAGPGAARAVAEPFLKRDVERADADDATGTVFLRGRRESLKEIQDLARLLDVQPKRVLLKIRVARVSRRAPVIGLCYRLQLVAHVPSGPLDQKVDWLVTEDGPIVLTARG